MIIDGCKRTGLLATLLVGAMMCVPSAANADAIRHAFRADQQCWND
jgi:hypothetical protein